MKKAIAAAVLFVCILSACSAEDTSLILPSGTSSPACRDITSFSFSDRNISCIVKYEVSKNDLIAHFSYGYESEPDVFSEKNWSEETWDLFMNALSNCGVFSWQGEYIETGVTNPEQWTLELTGDFGTLRVTGSNDYPLGWRSYMRVLNEYFGTMEEIVIDPSPSSSPSASPTAQPTEEISATSDPSDNYEIDAPPFSGFIMEPNDSTVVIADNSGRVLFGYSDGRWLTHSQAAAYCDRDMEFYSISLNGRKSFVNSNGAESGENEAHSSVNNDYMITNDYNNDIVLKFEVRAKGYMCHIDSERIPDFEIVKDYSSIIPLLQPLIDEQFGEGKVTAEITYAVKTDIDGDGEKETIVNASNLEGYDRYETFEPEEGNWYSIMCAIEQDGSFTFIQDSYDTGSKEDSWYWAIRGIADVNGDGICEILTENEGWEYWGMYLFFIEDNELVPPMIYDWTS